MCIRDRLDSGATSPLPSIAGTGPRRDIEPGGVPAAGLHALATTLHQVWLAGRSCRRWDDGRGERGRGNAGRGPAGRGTGGPPDPADILRGILAALDRLPKGQGHGGDGAVGRDLGTLPNLAAQAPTERASWAPLALPASIR